MSFFRNLANLFNPGRGLTRSVDNFTQNVLGPKYRSYSGGTPNANPTFILGRAGDAAIFDPSAVDTLTSIAAETNYFTETGERRPDINDAAATQAYLTRLGKFRLENKVADAGFKSEAEKTLEQLRFQREMNATGGVRGGRSRNPFTFATAPGVSQNTVARQSTTPVGGGGLGGSPNRSPATSQYYLR